MLIYIVTEGEYSDYRILAVFDKREYAEEFCGDDSWRGIEEYVVNPTVFGDERYSAFKVIMQKNGDSEVEDGDIREADRKNDTFEARMGRGPDPILNCTVMARDKQHAVKIVNERRTQLIDRWPTAEWVPRSKDNQWAQAYVIDDRGRHVWSVKVQEEE